MSHPLMDLYQVRISYTWDGLTHKFQTWAVPEDFNEPPGQIMSAYGFIRQGNTPVVATTSINAFIDFYKPLFHTTTLFGAVELWKYEEGSNVGSFVTAMTSTAAGTNGTDNVTASEMILTARTNTGRIKKLYAEENSSQSALPQPWVAGVTGVLGDLGEYMLDDGTWMRARDGSYIIDCLNILKGQSEAIFKKRLRP